MIGKQQMLQQLGDLFRACNMADSDNEDRAQWMVPSMAGDAGCVPIEKMVRAMRDAGAITASEYESFYSYILGEIDQVKALS